MTPDVAPDGDRCRASRILKGVGHGGTRYRPVLIDETTRVVVLHDILPAWRQGRIDYRRAMNLKRIGTLGELYQTAEHSGVAIRVKPHKFRRADLVADLIRGQAN